LLASVDRAGAVRVRLALAQGDVAPIVADVRFLRRLEARPRLHALLNATSAILLTAGLVCVLRKRIVAHLVCMIAAGVVTSCFLASYLYYHYHAGSVAYPGTGLARTVYFGILLSHTVLAAFVVPLAVGTYGLAAWRRFRRHRGLARWTLPIWLYVSITGVVIYWMLYA
jgi:putative membrane protein